MVRSALHPRRHFFLWEIAALFVPDWCSNHQQGPKPRAGVRGIAAFGSQEPGPS
jgi:hypothetical protein